MKLYHFCCMSQNPDKSLHYFSGTVSTDADMSDKEQYDNFVHNIAQAMEPKQEREDIVLMTLSIIG